MSGGLSHLYYFLFVGFCSEQCSHMLHPTAQAPVEMSAEPAAPAPNPIGDMTPTPPASDVNTSPAPPAPDATLTTNVHSAPTPGEAKNENPTPTTDPTNRAKDSTDQKENSSAKEMLLRAEEYDNRAFDYYYGRNGMPKNYNMAMHWWSKSNELRLEIKRH